METEPNAMAEPKCLFWFKVYAGFLAFIYLVLAAAGGVLLALPSLAGEERFLGVLGVVYLALGVVFAVAFLVPFFLKPGPFAWVYGLVLICIGFSGCPTVFASVALLIYWIKPETKAYFGKS